MKVDDFASLLGEANQLFLNNDYDGALSQYNAAIDMAENQKDKVQALSNKFKCLMELNRGSEAQQVVDRLMDLDGFHAHLRKGELAYQNASWTSALSAWQEALKHQKEHAWLQRSVDQLKTKLGIRNEKPSSAPSTAATDQHSQEKRTQSDRIKYNHFFMNGNCFLSVIGLRNIPYENRTLSFPDDESVHVNIQCPDGSRWEKTIHLYGKILVDQCSYKNYPSKVEISLHIKDKLNDWPRLEKEDNSAGYDINKIKKYPSSKSHTDWDKIDSELKSSEKDSDGNVNALFQQIFSNADDDTRKAMMKSYSESGGTVLSTNWNEVGNKRVEPSPPSNMEAKNYDQ